VDELLDQRVSVPSHVVRRSFADEVIVLNLDSGQYHGLNETAQVIVDRLDAGDTPREAARNLATQAGAPIERVEADVRELVECLLERGLVESDGRVGD
jgi:hypothetical protein